MFLGINEIRHEKARFILIMAVIALVSYLTFFLTALAYGLATSYTQGIDKWQADGIILQESANNNAARSLLNDTDYRAVRTSDDNKSQIGISSATISLDKQEDIALFGIKIGSFTEPNITEGRSIKSLNEVIASDKLKGIGLELNQKIKFSEGDTEYLVVGFTDRSTFQTAPIIYLDLDDWRGAATEASGMTAMRDNSTFSAVVVKGDNSQINEKTSSLSYQTITDYAFTLPGYSAQVATFSIMIGFLIFIASFVLAIFIYILTIQKKNIFGVLKAEGIPNKYISRSVKFQIVFLVVAGLLVGLILTLATGYGLGGKVPFMVEPLFFGSISVLFLLFAAIGGIASVYAITKIDPVEAIG